MHVCDYSVETYTPVDDINTLSPAATKLHHVLQSIWARESQHDENNLLVDPTRRFVITRCMYKGGVLYDTKDVSPVTVRLKWAVRLDMAYELATSTPKKSVQDVTQWLHVDVETPFRLLSQTTTRARHYSHITPSAPRYKWLDDNRLRIASGNVLVVAELQNMFNKQEASMVHLWEQDVLLGQQFNLPLLTPSMLKDDLLCKTPSYCFVDDERNKLEPYKHHLLNTILQSDQLCGRFLVWNDETSQWVWNKVQLLQWLKKYTELSMHLLMRCEMLSGGPG